MEFTSGAVKTKSVGNILTRTYLYMFIDLLITAVVATGLGILITWLRSSGTMTTADAANLSYGFIIGGGIATIILSIASSVYFLKESKHLKLITIIYTICMGIMLSGLVAWVDWKILLSAVGITALTFGLMSLIGIFSKGSLAPLATMGIALVCGAAILSIVLLIMMFAAPAASWTLYWIVDFAIFAAIILFAMFDIQNVKQMAEAQIDNENIAIMCALRLYTDVIYIFIRIVYYISLARR